MSMSLGGEWWKLRKVFVLLHFHFVERVTHVIDMKNELKSRLSLVFSSLLLGVSYHTTQSEIGLEADPFRAMSPGFRTWSNY